MAAPWPKSLFSWPAAPRSLGAGAVVWPAGYLQVNGARALQTDESDFLTLS